MAWVMQLGKPGGSLKPDASVHLLAAMVYPGPTTRERKARSRYVKAAKTATSLPGDASRRFRDGAVAGDMLLTLLQQHIHGESPSLNEALALVRGAILFEANLPPRGYTARQLEKEGKYSSLQWLRDDGRKIHRNTLLSTFRQFNRVAHLWAAYIHGQRVDECDYLLSADQNIPRFVGTAEYIAHRGEQITLRGGDRRLAIDRQNRLRLKLPPSMVEDVVVYLQPVSETARTMVTQPG